MNTIETDTKTAERAEREHLSEVESRLDRALVEADQRLNHYARDVQEQKEYLWESRAEMDPIEKIASRQSIEQSVMTGEAVGAQRRRLLKPRRVPYFGRFDFARTGDRAQPVYIGVHHFYDEFARENVVSGWRAPVASPFYDYELGPVRYEAPEGKVTGEVALKRQFRINDG